MAKRKAIWILFLISLLFLFLISCGPGEDGDAYITISWMFDPFTYWTDDPAIPYIFYNGEYYLASLGTYNFQYQSWDSSILTGQYTIYINEGLPGTLFSEGEDGSDIYFELLWLSIGTSFYAWDFPYSIRTISNQNDIKTIMLKNESNKYKLAGYNETTINTSAIKKKELNDFDKNILDDPEAKIFIQKGMKGQYGFIMRYMKIK